ncbi:MAG: type II toxin-antitoxin system PemK/MazF family toxin [Alphaproteobacteria bacterium]|nr:MAG: type II toxin-antitoxin system PemK/MazF family toxin [Alphaproteobacteria bacterium]
MAIKEHPPQGSVVTVDYRSGFKVPEMDKKRLAVVLSPNIRARVKLVTVVPLSLTAPDKVLPFHKQIDIPFQLPPEWGNRDRWIKGDMVNAVGFHRVDLLRLGKDRNGKRIYQMSILPDEMLKEVRKCVLHGMGLSSLTKHL